MDTTFHLRRLAIGLFAATLTVAFNAAQAAAEREVTRPPNVVIILADDLGYADVGFQGCKDIPTPNIDSLAAGGVRCTNGYVSCPVCSPTRAGLMTGRYQQRFGHEFNPGSPQQEQPEFGLPLDQITIAQQLKKPGYATGLVGKWHLGLKEAFLPPRRGFDEFFGFPHGAHSYIDAKADMKNPIMRGLQGIDEKEYLTDAFAREAVALIERQRQQPFFLYLAFNAVHTPMQAPDKYLQRFPGIEDQKRRTYAAMLSAMDDAIGQVLGKIRELDLERNTLIFFLSDNGGPPAANASRNDPLRGSKGTVYEGGIRVPFVVRWKGQLPEGVVYEHPVISLDIFPTAVAAARGQLPADVKLDGVNLLPRLKGEEKAPPHEALFWRFGNQCAVRRGNMKLLKTGEGAWQLYDLAKDIGESKDLAADKAEVVESMAKTYGSWNGELSEPRWKPASRARQAQGTRARQQRQRR